MKRDLQVPAPWGTARADLVYDDRSRLLVVLGHGAGGSSHTPVLLAIRDALLHESVATALVDQPYRVAGRRTPDPADRLDAAMLAVVDALLAQVGGVPVLLGGKSSGSRVGCRVARAAGAVGVVALGFPLLPPGRPERSRAAELDAGCPVLVVQGSRDNFGSPEDVRAAAHGLPVEVRGISGGDHSFVPRRLDGRTRGELLDEVAGAVTAWVVERVGTGPA